MTRVALVAPTAGIAPELARLLGGRNSLVQFWDPAFVACTAEGPGRGTFWAADVVGETGAEVVCIGPGLSDEEALVIARALELRDQRLLKVLIAAPSVSLWSLAARVGVRWILDPADIGDAWATTLEEILDAAERRPAAGSAAPEKSRRVIVVLSPKGGTGKTSVSVNLAAALARTHPDDVALVDLDVQFGDVASGLRLEPGQTLVDVARAGEAIDPTSLKVFLCPHSSGLWVLAAPLTPAAADEATPAASSRAISLLADQFEVVVVDTGSGLDEHTLGALEFATDLVFVTTLDVTSVRGLRKLIDVVDGLGVRARRHVVLNRCDVKSGVEVSDVAASLGLAIDVSLPSSQAVALSANHGVTLVESDSRSAVTKGILALVERLEPTPTAGATSTSRWLRRRKDGR